MPGWLPQWHCGVRAKQSGRLLAFIAAVPQTVRVYDKERPMVEINFLCVHKKLRSKRVAPVLIREITRRVNQQKIFQAVYTAGVVLPKPVLASFSQPEEAYRRSILASLRKNDHCPYNKVV
uniref:glycylpeptide N-tetradecanoyltransferase n=1 Tax=Angiostrongylus cantonensis TaxID=6313 RepID=A0A0K0D6Y1_ANGCA